MLWLRQDLSSLHANPSLLHAVLSSLHRDLSPLHPDHGSFACQARKGSVKTRVLVRTYVNVEAA